MGTGKVIFLNGSSSAGKTTLAIMLQQLLTEPYQHIALDQFRDGLPSRFRGLNSPPGAPGDLGLNIVPTEKDGATVTDVRFGSHGEQMLRGMRRAIAAFAREGNNVIIDDLIFKPEYLEDYAAALHDVPTWLVGIRCTIDVVNEREAQRSGRFPGTATSHFDTVHAHGASYDLEVDTSHATPRACAEEIIRRLEHAPAVLAELRRQLST